MINDHCGIVFAPFPVIGCTLGKTHPRGDLFKNMNERPGPGLVGLR